MPTRQQTPYELGRESISDRDAINPFDAGTDDADQWEDGRDPSMRDCYE